MEINRKVDFFIIGAPKCGTTSMVKYLNQHHRIYMSTPKEPYFFATDMPGLGGISDIEAYKELFINASLDQILGEASVWYLYSKEAIENIYNYNNKAKIIVMLRRPTEMVPSMHSQNIFSLDEDVADLEQAWSLCENRLIGKSVPLKCRDFKKILYTEICKYSEQLNRVYRYFNKSQVKVIFFEDLKDNPPELTSEVFNFLGVENKEHIDYSKENANKSHRNKKLAFFILRPPSSLAKFVKVVKKIFGIEKIGFLSYLRKINTVEFRRRKLSENLKRKIIDHYDRDIKKLEQLTGRDLSSWYDL